MSFKFLLGQVFDDFLVKKSLFRQDVLYSFLHTIFHPQLVNKYRLGLTDTVYAILGLVRPEGGRQPLFRGVFLRLYRQFQLPPVAIDPHHAGFRRQGHPYGLGGRNPLAVLGHGLAALTKPLFPLATSAAWILTARFVDRIGKGIRGAPRDALIADSSPPEVRGAAFGLRQSLDSVGAFLGPLAAIALMGLLADDIRTVFWIAAIPAFVAVTILVFGVKEPAKHAEQSSRRLPHWRDIRSLGGPFWTVVAVGAVFSLARFSEAFPILRAREAGFSFTWTPLALVVMNLAYFASAYPTGRLSDRLGRIRLLAVGLAVLILSDLVLALGQQIALVVLGTPL